MANAQNLRSAALPPAVHLHPSRISYVSRTHEPSLPPDDDPWSCVPSVQPDSDEGETIVRTMATLVQLKAPASTPSPLPTAPAREAQDTMRAAVEEALAPLRHRLDELERNMFEVVARIAAARPLDDAALHAERAGDRQRRLILALTAGLVVLNAATLLGVLLSR